MEDHEVFPFSIKTDPLIWLQWLAVGLSFFLFLA